MSSAVTEATARTREYAGRMALSEAAAGTLSFLRTIRNRVACEECVAAYLAIDRYDVLKSIRELIVAGQVLCTYADCTICRERRLVVQTRAGRPQPFGK